MKIALCQMENKGTIRENLEQSIRAIEEAALQKADLILFPEVQLTEFFPQYPGQDVSEYRVGQNSDIVKTFVMQPRIIRSWWCQICIYMKMGKHTMPAC